MPNAPQIDVKRKHRKRKARIKRNEQQQILKFAKKKTIEKLYKEGKLPKIAMGRL
jgi:hypothetical protein